jgi:hypothetical protein
MGSLHQVQEFICARTFLQDSQVPGNEPLQLSMSMHSNTANMLKV